MLVKAGFTLYYIKPSFDASVFEVSLMQLVIVRAKCVLRSANDKGQNNQLNQQPTRYSNVWTIPSKFARIPVEGQYHFQIQIEEMYSDINVSKAVSKFSIDF